MEAIFSKLNALEIQVGKHTESLERINMDLYNHGRDGMKTILTQHIAKGDEREIDRLRKEEEERLRMASEEAAKEKRHDAQARKQTLRLNVIAVIVAVMGLILACLTYVTGVRQVKAGNLVLPTISHASEKLFDAFATPDSTTAGDPPAWVYTN